MKPLRLISLPLLLALGTGLTAWLWRPADPFTIRAVLLALVLPLIPPVRKVIDHGLTRLREARPARVGAGIFLLATGIYTHGALFHRNYLAPMSHDEHSYTLGALLLSAGRLWTASPDAPDSFEAFHMFARPVYASIYAPGTAVLHVPDVWLRLPGWITAMLLTACAVAAVYLMLRPAIGGDLAVLASLLVMSAPKVRAHSILVLSQVPSLFVGSAVLWAAWSWRNSPTRIRAAMLGTLLGLLGIIRPQDLALFGPAALWLTLSLFPSRRRDWLTGAAIALFAATPFLSLALVQNWGLTGSPFHTGYGTYTTTMQPGTGFLLHETTTRPATLIAQKHDYNIDFGSRARADWAGPFWESIVRSRLKLALAAGLPWMIVAVFIPCGFVKLARHALGRGILIALVGFIAVYGTFTFYLPHYVIPVAGCVAGLVLAGALQLIHWLPFAAAHLRVGVALVVMALAISVIPGINPSAADLDMATGDLQAADLAEATLPNKPALLLFRYASGQVPFHQEPVYNLRSWRIDDHEVIRAHDLGPALNRKLFEAYARKSPRRYVYLFDRPGRQLHPLGWADDLARGTPATPFPPTPSATRP